MIKTEAYAKINWGLIITGKQEDGYHLLDTIMQSISLHDELHWEEQDTFSFTCSDRFLPADEQNLVVQTVYAYQQKAGIEDIHYHVHLVKNIPSMAGLGGGSADAAATLRFLQERYHRLSNEELDVLALSLGADVSFCLHQGARRCQGIGEKMTPVESEEYELLLVQPERGVSTKKLFAQVDQKSIRIDMINTEDMMTAIKTGDFHVVRRSVQNELMPYAQKMVPEIAEIVSTLYKAGAIFASMSGSGSCCFGVFDDATTATNAQYAFAKTQFIGTCHTKIQ